MLNRSRGAKPEKKVLYKKPGVHPKSPPERMLRRAV